MQSILDNYINGNLTEAKRQAKKHSHSRLFRFFATNGMGTDEAFKVAEYLKGKGLFQAACDASPKAKGSRVGA